MPDHQKAIVILGSTGSIGKSTLDVVRENRNQFKILGLSCNGNIKLLADQIKEFSPKKVSVGKGKSGYLKELLINHHSDLKILEDQNGLNELASHIEAETVVAAIVGASGIEPVMTAIQSGKDVALANKEAIVLAGDLITSEAKKRKVLILPIDSEHNAISQSLSGSSKNNLSFITLTASGGPFLKTPFKDFSDITPEDALKHPNWEMGEKITIDSASMMNKALEVIEAKWLFELQPEQIKVIVHPQSIIHSMVTFDDNSTICQMGVPDMKIPISYCLGYPKRISSGSRFLDLGEIGQLSFEEVDAVKFPTIQMAFDTLKMGGGAPAILNGANEVLVDLFLKKEIQFLQIFILLQKLVNELKNIYKAKSFPFGFFPTIKTTKEATSADQWGRDRICDYLN
ncbi:MAG: 1-deoxy-D-xylulose-5-phosphate reductoisomerase [Deltaproteobacteria bacterium]|nr:1-deoxy-D-xylulose-5-phosphate reductoisomerase [Deltaproteobacteria bacterium]